MPNRQISPQRKSLYHAGQIVAAVGLLSFLSVFVSAALNFGDFTDFESRGRSMAMRAFGGMIMIVAGGALMEFAFGGVAGSGLKLDPEQARRDLEPWARMSGGLQKDALDEMGIDIPAIVDKLGGRTTAAGETFEQRLRGLHALYKDGILNREEYEREKRELLDGT
jgi:hypothetical protein